jgi:hypothetical protein
MTERDPSADWILGLRGVRRRVDEGEGGPCECEPAASVVRPDLKDEYARFAEEAGRQFPSRPSSPDRCSTVTRGGYRCYREAGHHGQCEIETGIGCMTVTAKMLVGAGEAEPTMRPSEGAKLRQVTFPYQYQEDSCESFGTVTPIRPSVEPAPQLCRHSWRHLRTEIRSREFTDYKVDVFHCGHCLEYREVEWPR